MGLLRIFCCKFSRMIKHLCMILIFGLLCFIFFESSQQLQIKRGAEDFFQYLQQKSHQYLSQKESALSHNSSVGLSRIQSPYDPLSIMKNRQKKKPLNNLYVNITSSEKEEENPIARRLRLRREKVLEVCKSEGSPGCSVWVTLIHRMYFFHNHSTSVCTVAKSASSTWRAHLRRVNKGPPLNVPIHEDKIRKAFLERPLEAIMNYINSSAKIITVRHPLTRLVSAYRNKYNDGKPMPPYNPQFEKKLHKKIAGSYWDERFYEFWLPALFANNMVPSDTHLQIGLKEPIDPSVMYSVKEYEDLYKVLKPKVTFIQFLKFILQTYEERKPDDHWKSYFDTCCPCYFNYDYITKVETLSEELGHIFKKLGISANPETSMNQGRESLDNLYSYYKYYRYVPLNIKRKLYKYLKYDMELFGYTLPNKFLN